MTTTTTSKTLRNLSNKYGTVEIEFDSLTAAIQAAFDPSVSRSPEGARLASDRTKRANSGQDSQYYDGATESTCKEWLNHARKHVVDAVDSIRQEIERSFEMPTRKRRRLARHLEDGAELDPQAWLERKSDGWSDMVREQRDAKTVTVAVNVTVNSNRTPEQLLWRGAAAAAIVDILESRGTATNLIVYTCTDNPSDADYKVEMRTTVKSSDQPLDISAVATACAEIGFFRLVMINNQCHATTYGARASCGRATILSQAEKSKYAYVIDGDVFDRASAVESARRVLNAHA